MDPPFDSTLAASPASATASALIGGIGLAWIGPPITDEKASTALDFIADYLFREETASSRGSSTRRKRCGGRRTVHHVARSRRDGSDDRGDHAERSAIACSARSRRCARRWMRKPSTRPGKRFSTTSLRIRRRRRNVPIISAGTMSKATPGTLPESLTNLRPFGARRLDPAYVADMVKHYLATPVVVNMQAKESSQ